MTIWIVAAVTDAGAGAILLSAFLFFGIARRRRSGLPQVTA